MVAVQIHPPPAALAGEALFHSLGVGVAEVGKLGDAELEPEPRDELRWREAVVRV